MHQSHQYLWIWNMLESARQLAQLAQVMGTNRGLARTSGSDINACWTCASGARWGQDGQSVTTMTERLYIFNEPLDTLSPLQLDPRPIEPHNRSKVQLQNNHTSAIMTTYQGRCHCGQTEWETKIDGDAHILWYAPPPINSHQPSS